MPKIKRTENFYSSGDHNILCWVCRRKMKASDAWTRYDGRLVCKDDLMDEIDPSTKLSRVDDRQLAPKPIRPEPTDSFVPCVMSPWARETNNWEDIDCLWNNVEDTL